MHKRSAAITLAVVLLTATGAFAVQQNGGNPFAEIWAELASLGARVLALEAGNGGGLPTVVDDEGKVIGQMLDANSVLVEIDGFAVAVPISVEGVTRRAVGFVYDGVNCTGTEYLSAGSRRNTPLLRTAQVGPKGDGYYPGEPFGLVNTFSRRNSVGDCFNLSEKLWAALPNTFDPDDIGTPPFALQ
jgi:hypothetical protein